MIFADFNCYEGIEVMLITCKMLFILPGVVRPIGWCGLIGWWWDGIWC